MIYFVAQPLELWLSITCKYNTYLFDVRFTIPIVIVHNMQVSYPLNVFLPVNCMLLKHFVVETEWIGV